MRPATITSLARSFASRLLRTGSAWIAGLVLAFVLAACAKKDHDGKGASRERAAEPGVTGGAPVPAPPARHQVLAEKLVAALASGDYAQLEALRKKPAGGEPRESLEERFRKLRERLAGEKIDLARSSISRVEATGQGIEAIEVFLAYNGRMFQLHFTAMAAGGTYTLLGIADWVRWV